ncbi:MAG: hypothetical protein LBG97_00450 [Coriobacteriales bacterium]|jgi:hypothetical protein|nr:hypothetical protein [Coriobacteriales bacterium]
MSDPKRQQHKEDSSNFDLDKFMASLDVNDTKPRNAASAMQEALAESRAQKSKTANRLTSPSNDKITRSKERSAALDPNATMSYEALGEDYPELPFASKTSASTSVNANVNIASADRLSTENSSSSRLNINRSGTEVSRSTGTSRAATTTGTASNARRSSSLRTNARSTSARVATASTDVAASQSALTGISSTRKSNINATPSRQGRRTSAMLTLQQTQTNSQAAQQPLGAVAAKRSLGMVKPAIATRKNGLALYSGAGADAILPISEEEAYSIRGGGHATIKSPLFTAVSAAIIVVGVVVISLLVYNIVGVLSTIKPTANSISFTKEQTRSALDGNMPLLTGILDNDFDAVGEGLSAAGFITFVNDRYSSDSPDATAQGREIIRMPEQVTNDFMLGFFEGNYSAYSPKELEASFNGTWVLDLTRGDLGSLYKLKYVNFKATSIADEMDHLAQLQGMDGNGVSIAAKGIDTRGNNVIQGTKVVDDRVYYFKIAACTFNEVYTAAKLDDSSVYISITIASYDFYTGGDEITQASTS